MSGPCLAADRPPRRSLPLRADDLSAAVIDAARRGDPAGIEAVYRRYAPAVLAWFRSRLGDGHLAEDLTGDAFVAVIAALPRYTGGPEAFAGWLFTLVRRDFVDHLRRTARRPETPTAEPVREELVADTADEVVAVIAALPRYTGGPEAFAGWLFTLVRRDFVDHLRRTARRPETPTAEPVREELVADTADEVVARAEGERVRAALAQLSSDQQEVLVLRVVAGLTAPEVAEATGRTVGAVKALQHRGLDSLGRLLGKEKDPYPRKAVRRL